MKALKVSEFLIGISSGNHVSWSFAKFAPQLRTVRNYGVCSRHVVWRREMVMPIGRFIIWVGTSLLGLLFVANWCLPKSLPEPEHDASNKPIIRIASIQQPPERVVIDTSQPTIVPPPTLVGDAVPGEPSPLQSYASTAPPPTVIDVDKKRRKVTKRQGPKLASNQPPFASTPAAAGGGSATTVPLTKLSFMDIISGMRRSLFKLN
jgi:hypothetical protein